VGVVTSLVPSLVSVGPGSQQTFTTITAIRTSLDTNGTQPWQAAQADFIAASKIASFGFQINDEINGNAQETLPTESQLYSSHLSAWKKIWKSGIEVEGNLTLAHHINSSLYYLLSSVRDDYPWPPSPGGIATNGYSGNIFWDFEMWMFPPLLLLHPLIATTCLHYRTLRVEEAKKWATANGYLTDSVIITETYS